MDGILPEGRHNIKSGNLTIVRLQDSDRGIYQCSASNQAATITTDSELIVENTAPRAPMNITAFASHTAVTLKWVPGQVRSGSTHKIDYNVWYKPVEQTEWRTIRIGQGITEVTIGELNPGNIPSKARDTNLKVYFSYKNVELFFSYPNLFSFLIYDLK